MKKIPVFVLTSFLGLGAMVHAQDQGAQPEATAPTPHKTPAAAGKKIHHECSNYDISKLQDSNKKIFDRLCRSSHHSDLEKLAADHGTPDKDPNGWDQFLGRYAAAKRVNPKKIGQCIADAKEATDSWKKADVAAPPAASKPAPTAADAKKAEREKQEAAEKDNQRQLLSAAGLTGKTAPPDPKPGPAKGGDVDYKEYINAGKGGLFMGIIGYVLGGPMGAAVFALAGFAAVYGLNKING